MTPSPLNSPQHVERIREILIGRDLQQMHDRISRIEETPRAMASPGLQEALPSLLNEDTTANLRAALPDSPALPWLTRAIKNSTKDSCSSPQI